MAVLSQAHNIFVLVSHHKQSSNMPTNQWAIITGASAGIGASTFRRLVQEEPNLNCLGVARRMSQLELVKTNIMSSTKGCKCKISYT